MKSEYPISEPRRSPSLLRHNCEQADVGLRIEGAVGFGLGVVPTSTLGPRGGSRERGQQPAQHGLPW